MNLFKIIAHQTWGADQSTLLTLYRTLIRSKLDYGAIVYGSARKSYLKISEPVANQALRICLGAYRTSPVCSLQVLAHEPPLELRREQLLLAIRGRANDLFIARCRALIVVMYNNPHFPHTGV